MNKKLIFDEIFKDFILGKIPKDKIINLSNYIDKDDITWLMDFIENLNDPSDYFSGDQKRDENAISGFFLIIDLVSFFIIKIGDDSFDKINSYRKSKSRYIPWILKYIDDDRFHSDLVNKFYFN
jgi:hypothetical protein